MRIQPLGGWQSWQRGHLAIRPPMNTSSHLPYRPKHQLWHQCYNLDNTSRCISINVNFNISNRELPILTFFLIAGYICISTYICILLINPIESYLFKHYSRLLDIFAFSTYICILIIYPIESCPDFPGAWICQF